MLLPKQTQAALKVGVPFRLEEDVGLGDVIKRATAKAGIMPCAPCQARAEALNRRVVFTGRPPRGS
jgi:hypothetical protein